MNEEIEKALQIINSGGLILYPTDTIWGIGCDAANRDAVEKIYRLKKRSDSKALICLVSDIRMLENTVYEVPEVAYDILRLSEKPVTIIYDKPIAVAKNLIAADDTVAIRIPKSPFCEKLIRKMKRPLVSTSANISGRPTPRNFREIPEEILKGVDYIVNLHRHTQNGTPSTIIKLGNDGTVKVIRK